MMVRYVMRWLVDYGHYGDAVRGVEACNAIRRDRGWGEWTPWSPITGTSNEIVLIWDSPDLATFVADRDAMYADAEFMNVWKKCVEHSVERSRWAELLEPVAQLA